VYVPAAFSCRNVTQIVVATGQELACDSRFALPDAQGLCVGQRKGKA
jgi:hypothetical protein